MNNELIFLTIITIIVLGFCIVNVVSYLINKNHTKEAEGTVISVKMPNPTTEKMRNSKWAIVTYKVAGKNYTSQNRIQIPMSAEVGSHIPVHYNTKQPEMLYQFSAKRIAVSALIFIICVLIITYKIM